MQYIPGKSLDKVIAEGPASLQLVLSAGIQIADGLSAAHQLGIFHRDLKPANVMLTDGGLIKILDFGLARQLNLDEADFDPASAGRRTPPPAEATYTARGGTIAYMAPEQFVTGRSSVQSDVFALGLILYELASGRHPFHRPDAAEFQTIRAIQFADPPNLREIVPELSVELDLILRCLEKQPSPATPPPPMSARACKHHHEGAAVRLRHHPRRLHLAVPAQGRLELETARAGKAHHRHPLHARRALPRVLRRRKPRSTTPSSSCPSSTSNLGRDTEKFPPAPLYGYALADAIAARIARMSSLVVRPSSALMQLPIAQMDPLAIGQKLIVDWVLTGNFIRSAQGFDLNWQLLEVEQPERPRRRFHRRPLIRPHRCPDRNLQRSLRLTPGPRPAPAGNHTAHPHARPTPPRRRAF
jgi:serine/threonine protein kinase